MINAATTQSYKQDDLCILAGEGILPVEVARCAQNARNVFIIAIKGITDTHVEQFSHVWLSAVHVGKILKYARQYRNLLIVGRFRRSLIKRVVFFDWVFLRHIFSILRTLLGGDDHFSRFIVRILKEIYDVDVLGVQDIAPQLLAPNGVLTHEAPNKQDLEDIDRAICVLRSLSCFDVGQGVIIARGRVVAIEAADGTNNMLDHARDMASFWRQNTQRRGVLVKMSKVNQERRMDLPVVGTETIEKAFLAGLKGIAFEAGGVLIASLDDVVTKANAYGMYLYGFEHHAAANTNTLESI